MNARDQQHEDAFGAHRLGGANSGPQDAQERRRGPSLAQDAQNLAVEAESLRRAYTIPQRAQTQESLTAQLNALKVAAVRLGLYDAHDWLRREDV